MTTLLPQHCSKICDALAGMTDGSPDSPQGQFIFMKLIPLTQGKFAKVDDADFERVNEFQWHVAEYKGGINYAHTKVIGEDGERTTLKMHRFILGVTDSKSKVDHIDHNGLNNQRLNLRMANNSQNAANKTKRKNSSSKYLGVNFVTYRVRGKNYCYWRSQTMKDYKPYSKNFKTEIEAALWYNEMAKQLHGEFANLNIIEG